MYFQDLTTYEYLKGRESSALNVGWLDAAHPFPCGDVPDGFVLRVRKLARKPVNATRGFHVCQFCHFSPVVVDAPHAQAAAKFQQWQDAGALGNAEIRVIGRDGSVYAAPTLICHYIEAHRYQPPQRFVEAVMEMDRDCLA